MAAALGVAKAKPRGSLPCSKSSASAPPSTPASRIAASVGARSRLASRRPSSWVDQRVMQIGRLGQAEQLCSRRWIGVEGAQVRAAHDQVHPARRIVDDAGE